MNKWSDLVFWEETVVNLVFNVSFLWLVHEDLISNIRDFPMGWIDGALPLKTPVIA